MEPTLSPFKAAILRQQVVQILVALTAIFGFGSDSIDWDATVAQIFGGITGAIAVWTFITRLIKPAPNLTMLAADRERELVADGKLQKQRGFAVPLQLIALLGVALCVLSVVGCTNTVRAYKNAKTLPDTAYVVGEHYAAVVKQAADIAQNPATPQSVKDALKAADQVVKPIVLGDDQTNRPGLRGLAEKYQAVRDAQTEADLQQAIDNAVRELTHFINAVKSARSQTNAFTTNPGTDRNARRCFGLGAPGAEERRGLAVCAG